MVNIIITKIDENGNPLKARVEDICEGDTFVHPLNPNMLYVANNGKLISFER